MPQLQLLPWPQLSDLTNPDNGVTDKGCLDL